MNIKRTFAVLCACAALAYCPLTADSLEEYDKKIKTQTQRLKELDRQIRELRSELEKYRREERGIVAEMDNTDRRISLAREKIRVQERELALRRDKQAELERDHARAEDRGEALLERYEKRVRRAYKLRPERQWDLFVDAASPREFYYRVKYISAVNRADRELYDSIKDNMELISQRRRQIREETAAIRDNMRDLEAERASLEDLRRDKQKQYEKIRSDRNLLAEQIAEKERSKKEISNIIERTQEDKKAYLARLEEERKKREIVERPFSEKKGELPWPVHGRVVGKYGTHRHPVLGTVTENSGIDIRSAGGNPVRAVSDGMVVTVTWLRGFGNTIIVMHDNSYYTVYSHVEDIRIVQDEYVDSGQQIAVVSNDGSIGEPVLHFELWQEQQKLDPGTWLKK